MEPIIMHRPFPASTGYMAIPFQQSRRGVTAWHRARLFRGPSLQRRNDPTCDSYSFLGNRSISSRPRFGNSSVYGTTSRKPLFVSFVSAAGSALAGGAPAASRLTLCSCVFVQQGRPHSECCAIGARSPLMRSVTQAQFAVSPCRIRLFSHHNTHSAVCCSMPDFHQGEFGRLPSWLASFGRPRAARLGAERVSPTAACARKRPRPASAASAAGSEGGKEGLQGLGDLMKALGQMMSQGQQQQQQQPKEPAVPALYVTDLSYQPPGTAQPLLQHIDMSLEENQLGLVYGRSGAGKTTLLKIVAGLALHDSGTVHVGASAAAAAAAAAALAAEPAAVTTPGNPGSSASVKSDKAKRTAEAADRLQTTGLVFQFPERHFLGATIEEELTFGWPSGSGEEAQRIAKSLRTRKVLDAVGMGSMDLKQKPQSLSDGFKRRLALAVQLVRGPTVLLLDEPLAGLDWSARTEIATLLGKLKEECTVVVVSHDLYELQDQVDHAWEMMPGGRLESAQWPPAAQTVTEVIATEAAVGQ